MSLALLVYMVAVIPKIGIAAALILIGVLILGGIALLGTSVDLSVYGNYGDKDPSVARAKSTRAFLVGKLWVPFLLLVVAIVTPSKETLYTMIAAYGVEKVIENPVAQDLASDGVDVLKQLMARAKKELAEDAPKESK